MKVRVAASPGTACAAAVPRESAPLNALEPVRDRMKSMYGVSFTQTGSACKRTPTAPPVGVGVGVWPGGVGVGVRVGVAVGVMDTVGVRVGVGVGVGVRVGVGVGVTLTVGVRVGVGVGSTGPWWPRISICPA